MGAFCHLGPHHPPTRHAALGALAVEGGRGPRPRCRGPCPGFTQPPTGQSGRPRQRLSELPSLAARGSVEPSERKSGRCSGNLSRARLGRGETRRTRHMVCAPSRRSGRQAACSEGVAIQPSGLRREVAGAGRLLGDWAMAKQTGALPPALLLNGSRFTLFYQTRCWPIWHLWPGLLQMPCNQETQS